MPARFANAAVAAALCAVGAAAPASAEAPRALEEEGVSAGGADRELGRADERADGRADGAADGRPAVGREAEILDRVERRGPPAPPDVDGGVAALLLERSRELYGAGEYEAARALAVEAIERDPEGERAPEALGLVADIGARLGEDDPYRVLTETSDEPRRARNARERPRAGETDWGLTGYGAAYGGFGSAALWGIQSDDGSASRPAIAMGALGAGAGGALGYYVSRRYELAPGQAASAAAGGAWGTATGGFLGHVLTGIDRGHPNQIAGSAALGGLVGTALGAGYGVERDPPARAVHFAGSLSAYATAAALFINVAMDPPTAESYSLNAALGGTAGLGAGVWIAEARSAPSSAQMLRADAGAAAGVAGSWLFVYPLTGSARATGALSVAALAGGALTGLYIGRDAEGESGGGDGAASGSAAGAALIRSPEGAWRRGVPLLKPMGSARELGAEVSLGLDLIAGRF